MKQVLNFDSSGNLVTVTIHSEQYSDIKLTRQEAQESIARYMKNNRLDRLTVDQVREALRLGREKKHFDRKTADYFHKIYKMR